MLDRVLHRVLQSTESTDIEFDSYLLVHKMAGHSSRHDAEEQMLSHCCLDCVKSQGLGVLTNYSRCFKNDLDVQVRVIQQVHVSSKTLYSHSILWLRASAVCAFGYMWSTRQSHLRISIPAALYGHSHMAYGLVHTEVHVGSPGEIQWMAGSLKIGVG